MPSRIAKTQDGSHTVISNKFEVEYHSKHGAIQESEYVFIDKGFRPVFKRSSEQINIFEMGFGTGLNTWLTYVHNHLNNTHPKEIHYHAIEKYPLDQSTIELLNYPDLKYKADSNAFHQIHQAPLNLITHIGSNFTLFKIQGDFLQDVHSFEFYDLVYYDAFGPRSQPELWDLTACQKIYDILRPNGRMVTYCAQGQFKRNLKSLGLEVESIPGPPGKREMTIAKKL